jgi:hypothetical protein
LQPFPFIDRESQIRQSAAAIAEVVGGSLDVPVVSIGESRGGSSHKLTSKRARRRALMLAQQTRHVIIGP